MRTNMAITHRRLLSWFTSRSPLYVFLKILPLFAFLIYIMFTLYAGQWRIMILSFIFGWVTWSLMEYIIHRWVYHVPIKNPKLSWVIDAFHLHHHKDLSDHEVLNAGFLLVYPLFIIISTLTYFMVRDAAIASAYVFGILVYYFLYEMVHYFIHYRIYSRGYMAFIQKYHLYHHFKRWNKNYGNTTSFWDRVLGTYDASYKTFSYTDEQKTFFIKQ